MKALVLTLILGGMLGGCANTNEQVLFLTKTSLGVEVTAQPNSASIGYDRFEGYIGPRFENGAVPPVAASFETNGQLLGRKIRQLYATGPAALVVSGVKPVTDPDAPLTGAHKVMLFSTGTTVGLKIGFAATGATDVFTLGYKRREISIIPITEKQFPSVLATIQTDVKADAKANAEFGVGQYFATGRAATAVAGKSHVKQLFDRRLEEIAQGASALAALTCLADLPDADLARVFTHAEATKVFAADRPSLPADLKAMPAATARSTYTRYVALIDAQSEERSVLLERHRHFVCGLAGR